MNIFIPILIFVALGAVAATLVLGLMSLAKSGPDRSRSNRLMQWRIGLQGAALVIIVIAIFMAKSHQ